MNKPKSELYIYELNLPVYIIENICNIDIIILALLARHKVVRNIVYEVVLFLFSSFSILNSNILISQI